MRRMKKAGQYLLGIFAALLLCGVFSVNTVKAESQHIYDNASLLSDAEEQDLERSCAEFENNTEIHMVILTERSSGSTKPTTAPYCQPQTRPHKSTGMCIGSSMLPICGIWPVSMGSTRHSAKKSAA